MKILVCGASGFIGQALVARLRSAGHVVIRGVRRPTEPHDVAINYATDIDPGLWSPRLEGIDAVVNAVGIIAERPGATFENLHDRAPKALFEACARAGVRRVVQISSLGAETGDTAYFSSKSAADHALMASTLEWQVLRPSLVFGEAGASASAFRMLASMPVIILPALPANARFQPVHIDDLADAVVRALEPGIAAGQQVNCVGAASHTLPELLGLYRQAFRLGRALWLQVPATIMAATARIADLVPGSALNAATWRMLAQGSSADAGRFAAFLGREPKAPKHFIEGSDAERLRARAMASWQQPMLRLSLAAVWILSAITSAFVYPRSDSLALLAQCGITGPLATASLYAASALDLALGIATLAYPRRVTWISQMVVIAGYSAVIALALPEWLMHPFGPVLKNLPLLAILVTLLEEEPKWTTPS